MQPKQHGTKVELLQSAQLSTCIQPEHPESDGAVLMLRECIGGSGKPIQQWQFNSTSGTVRSQLWLARADLRAGRCSMWRVDGAWMWMEKGQDHL